MSRAITYLVILILLAVLAIAPRQDDGGTGREPAPVARHQSEVATFTAFEKLLATPEWKPADPPRNPQGMLEAVHEKTGLVFVLIPAGSFQMGSPEDEDGRDSDEDPVHTVTVPAFLLCRTECTQRAWEKAGGRNPSHFKGADYPVELVNWTKCEAWCRQAGLRLPSEAEWEYACRAGSTNRFTFGKSEAGLEDYGWYGENSDRQTHPVAVKLPNIWGLYDMHGNVWEWCEDWTGMYFDAPTDGTARTAMENWSFKVFRGGGYLLGHRYSRSAARGHAELEYLAFSLGFRPAADLPK